MQNPLPQGLQAARGKLFAHGKDLRWCLNTKMVCCFFETKRKMAFAVAKSLRTYVFDIARRQWFELSLLGWCSSSGLSFLRRP